MKKIKYFSMFSGIGGFEYGMEQSKHDFECVGYSEVDKYAESIYTRHFPTHRKYGDATKINTKDLPEFNFLVGGFPCQAFSIAGKRKGFNDTRGTLFFEIARILQDKKPEYFLLENVKGLLSHDGGGTFQKILEVLNELRYDVIWKIYNSKNYGVPQNRERVFIKGCLRGKGRFQVLFKPRIDRKIISKRSGKISKQYYGNRTGRVHNEEGMNTLTTSSQNSGSRQLIILNDKKSQGQRIYDSDGLACTLSANGGGQGAKTGLYKINKVGNVSPTNHHSGDVLSTDGIGRTLCARDYKDPMKIAQPVITPGRKDKRQNGRRMKKDGELMFTLTAQDIPGVYDGFIVRKLTPLECERLQGFPDGWTEYGKDGEKISDTQRYKCCGNAVTTSVITAIVDEMFKG